VVVVDALTAGAMPKRMIVEWLAGLGYEVEFK